MGRIKTALIKRITKDLVAQHGNKFSEDYSKNKEILKQYTGITSPKIRNTIAGYVSRLVKQAKEGKEKRKMIVEDISRFY